MSYLWERLDERRLELIEDKHLFVKKIAPPLQGNDFGFNIKPLVMDNDVAVWSKDPELKKRIYNAFEVSLDKDMVNWRVGGPLIACSKASWVKGKLVLSWDISKLIEDEVEFTDNDHDKEGKYLRIHPSRYPYVMSVIRRYADLETMIVTLTSDQIDTMNISEIYELTTLIAKRVLREDVPSGTKLDSDTIYGFRNCSLWKWEMETTGFMNTIKKELGLSDN